MKSNINSNYFFERARVRALAHVSHHKRKAPRKARYDMNSIKQKLLCNTAGVVNFANRQTDRLTHTHTSQLINIENPIPKWQNTHDAIVSSLLKAMQLNALSFPTMIDFQKSFIANTFRSFVWNSNAHRSHDDIIKVCRGILLKLANTYTRTDTHKFEMMMMIQCHYFRNNVKINLLQHKFIQFWFLT